MRTKANNEFKKNFFKLLTNAIYGKTMENVRDRVDVKLRKEWGGPHGAAKLIADLRFKRRLVFHENCVIIEMKQTHVF